MVVQSSVRFKAASSKQQAASSKQQAASSKQQAASSKLGAETRAVAMLFSDKREKKWRPVNPVVR
ncbi:hypothetical protein ACS016_11955 [Aeromonas veronii]|uniref:hypothetical protein n=1 Tax=Aeromonas veronii TaxID=654 RepID=UPI003F7B61B1